MTDRPILFSGPMIRAIRSGKKTQTRRVIPVQPSEMEIADHQIGGAIVDAEAFPDRPYVWLNGHDGSPVMPIINPPKYLPGDRLWVREQWSGDWCWRLMKPADRGKTGSPSATQAWYWADGDPDHGHWEKLRPSIHMPRWASRLTLAVTDVRVERLKDISREDCVAEGCAGWVAADQEDGEMPEEEFQDLWNTLNADRAPWASNPWVVAITFVVHHCNIDELEV